MTEGRRSPHDQAEIGVILMFGGDGDPLPDYSIGGFQIALLQWRSLRRQLASELGPHSIRAVSLRTGGIVDTIPEDFEGGEAIEESIVQSTMLKRGPRSTTSPTLQPSPRQTMPAA